MSLIWWLRFGEWRGGPEVGGPWYAFQYGPKLMMMMGKEHNKVSTGCYLLTVFPWLKLQLDRRPKIENRQHAICVPGPQTSS